MTSKADAVEAARVYRETQPAIDALKETRKANDAAKKILGPYMDENQLDVFRGVTMQVVTRKVLDGDKLAVFLGDKLKDFRRSVAYKNFGLAKRRVAVK